MSGFEVLLASGTGSQHKIKVEEKLLGFLTSS
jgi:hypothetical protein